MPTTAYAQLGASAADAVRRIALPGGRAWLIYDGATLAANRALADRISAALEPVAVRAFPHATPAFIALVCGADALAARTRLMLLHDADGQVGGVVTYSAGVWDGVRCFYASSAFVAPEHQGAGLVGAGYRLLLRMELLRTPLRPLYAAVRTPNPVVYEGWRRAGVDLGVAVEPRIGVPISAHAERAARAIAAANGFADRLDPRTLIVRGAYEGGVRDNGDGPYARRPSCGDLAIDALFARQLGVEDAVLVVARVTLHRAALIAGHRAMIGRIARRRRLRPGVAQRPIRVASGVERRAGAERRGLDRRRGAHGGWNGVERRRGGDRRAKHRRASVEHDSAA